MKHLRFEDKVWLKQMFNFETHKLCRWNSPNENFKICRTENYY